MFIRHWRLFTRLGLSIAILAGLTIVVRVATVPLRSLLIGVHRRPLTVIIAALEKDNATFTKQGLGLQPYDDYKVYFADSPSSVPINKGREAMVYLTYLIENYNTLPGLMVFIHAHRKSWHNNGLFRLSTSEAMKQLQRSTVYHRGFIHLACDKHLLRVLDEDNYRRLGNVTGIPAFALTREHLTGHIHRLKVNMDDEHARFRRIFHDILPDQPIPTAIAVTPGGQFALTRSVVHKTTLTELQRLRQWIIDTELNERSAGAVFEQLWQMIFVHDRDLALSPRSSQKCYCDLYGVCLSGPLFDEAMARWHQSANLTETLKEIEGLSKLDLGRQRCSGLQYLTNGDLRCDLANLQEVLANIESLRGETDRRLDDIIENSYAV